MLNGRWKKKQFWFIAHTIVETHSIIFEQKIQIGIELIFTTFAEHYHYGTAIFNVFLNKNQM